MEDEGLLGRFRRDSRALDALATEAVAEGRRVDVDTQMTGHLWKKATTYVSAEPIGLPRDDRCGAGASPAAPCRRVRGVRGRAELG